VRATLALFILLICGILLVVRHDAGTIAGLDSGQMAALVSGLALLVYLSGGLGRSGPGGGLLGQALTWAALMLGLVLAYSYRDDLQDMAMRVQGELMPSRAVVSTDPEGTEQVTLRRARGGHFHARTLVNGEPVEMIVDTGASAVTLAYEDALRIGIDPDDLSFTTQVVTANGMTMAARVTLDELSVGPLAAERVSALVTHPGTLGQSLLGMTYLDRLSAITIAGNSMTLRP
jgi:aspartyl protease family protein